MRKLNFTFYAFLSAIALLVFAYTYDHLFPQTLKPVPAAKTKVQTIAPDFPFTPLSGETGHLTDLRGKTVILNFWATWCAPCVTEFPTLVDLTEKYPDQVVVLALSSDKNKSDVENFVTALEKKIGHKINKDRVIIAIDENRLVTRDIFQITTYPESLIIGPDGTQKRHIIGINEWDKPDVQMLFSATDKLPGL